MLLNSTVTSLNFPWPMILSLFFIIIDTCDLSLCYWRDSVLLLPRENEKRRHYAPMLVQQHHRISKLLPGLYMLVQQRQSVSFLDVSYVITKNEYYFYNQSNKVYIYEDYYFSKVYGNMTYVLQACLNFALSMTRHNAGSRDVFQAVVECVNVNATWHKLHT